MRRGALVCLLAFCGGLAAGVAAAPAPTSVQNLRMWRAPDNTRLVFDLSSEVTHRVFVLTQPDRIVVDLDNARFQGTLPAPDAADTLLAAIRSGRPDNGTLRFVIDLKRAATPRSFVLKPIGEYGHRLVIDLIDPLAQAEAEEAAAETPLPELVPEVPAPEPRPTPATPRRWVIAVDAGHGGEDPGARGKKGTREKDVTLAIARELARQIDREPDMQAVLTRDGDYFVDLEQRARRAQRHRADVFISIHADAVPGRRLAFGSSVFALSDRGATNALSRALADQENKSDLIGGVDLQTMPSDVQRTLLDLQLEKKKEHSVLLGEDILAELKQIGRVHMRQVAQAGFMVLRSKYSASIPSVLVETAFISTPSEEAKLRDPAYQRRLATAILKGTRRYLSREGQTMPDTRSIAAAPELREHVVRAGDTLASIARRYNVNVEALRFLNQLTGDDLRVGTRLRLPLGESDG